MVKWFWAAVAICFLAFIFLTFKIGVGPRPIQVIKPSLAQSPEEIGFWTYRQLRHIVFKHQVIFLGIDGQGDQFNEQIKVSMGFWESAKNDNQPIEIIVRPQNIKTDIPAQTIELTEPEQVLDLLTPELLNQRKALVILPSQNTSHVIKDSLVKKFEQKTNQNVMALSLLDWRPDHPVAKLAQPHCEEAKQLTGFPDFGLFHCLYLGRSRKLVAMKVPLKFGFMVDQYGQSDFVVLIYP
jgi:hypothetical protein